MDFGRYDYVTGSDPGGGEMSNLVPRIDKWFYPEYANNWDDTMLRDRVLRVVTSGDTILDLGAGAGIIPQMNFKGLARQVCGIDLDRRVLTQNRFLDEAQYGSAEAIPYPNDTFDCVLANNVMEHLPAPETVYQEVYRVLKPGGHFLFKTPNKWHYMPLIARCTPLWFHQYINRKRGRHAEDTFPTKYLANSVARIRTLAEGSGMHVQSIEAVEGRPEYTRLTSFTYCFGFLYERVVNRVPGMSAFRIVLIGHLQKP